MTQAVTTAIILAGGFGTRLRAAVSDVPKPLAPVGGRPFLALQLDWLERHGIESVCISAHYMADKILSYAAEARQTTGLAINVVVEDEPLGTGGAVCHAMNSIADTGDVVVMNGDTYYAFDLRQLTDDHRTRQGIATMAVAPVENCSRYGTVEIEGGKVRSFRQAMGAATAGLVNCGLYAFSRKALTRTPSGPFNMEKDFFPQLAADGVLNACLINDAEAFTDIGLPEAYAEFSAKFVQGA